MNVLVTGAEGFLGQHVVAALRGRGHRVRALGSPTKTARGCAESPEATESIRADLCTVDLGSACEGMSAVVHLAMRTSGDPASVVRNAECGTRRLLEAVERSGIRQFLLASSLSVYSWQAGRTITELSPLETEPRERDAYTAAKLRQEELARQASERAGIRLAVLRPAALWGRGRELPPTIGQRLGPLWIVIEGARQLPSLHVENCANAFASVLESGRDGTFDVIDDAGIRARAFLDDALRRSGRFGLVVPVGYRQALRAVTLMYRIVPRRLSSRLPSFVHPARFAARYAPVRVEAARLREELSWRPLLSYEECLERTYGAGSLQPGARAEPASPRTHTGSP